MPVTQDRLRDLLTEYKRYLDAFGQLIQGAVTREDAGFDARTKYLNIVAELENIRAIQHPRFTIEWDLLNRNWKRNQRQAEIQRNKRARLGVVPRRPHEGIAGDYIPRGILSLSPDQMREEEEYARFNAGLEGGETLPVRKSEEVVTDQTEMQLIQCQFELGLANKPTEEQFTAWKERKGL